MAPIPEKLFAALRGPFPNASVIMASGMTEALSASLAQWPGMGERKLGSWGHAGPHAEVRVVDSESGVEMPAGEQGERVVAVVVPADGMPADDAAAAVLADDIMNYAREHLNSSHRPREVRFLAELPRTGSGKVRKVDLRDDTHAPGKKYRDARDEVDDEDKSGKTEKSGEADEKEGRVDESDGK